ncbi:MAG: xylulokinase, partial [Verrucomicrobia bacterium]|nr:xylulokinase [Verrucomicrobiota bacterium]
MRTLVIGIDSGTQSTKALVVNAKTGEVLAAASESYDLIGGLPPGAKEQNPADWIAAVTKSIQRAMKEANASASEVKAIGVSGQQHGFVPLDAEGQVIRPAKLWCDTATAEECEAITRELGGLDGAISELGNAVLPGYTAGKILWLKRHEPENFKRLRTILLPHDYINYWLTGNAVMEYGDASGTALLNVRTRTWSRK